MKNIPKIYTIGSSSRSINEFISLLKKYHVEVLVDVRRFPTSKYEHFKKEKLSELLNEAGVEYIYLGKELGGFRTGGYIAYMETPEYKEVLNRLEDIGRAKSSCFMCAEKDPKTCHRRFIARSLRLQGWNVIDII